jgi:hypothetical protein
MVFTVRLRCGQSGQQDHKQREHDAIHDKLLGVVQQSCCSVTDGEGSMQIVELAWRQSALAMLCFPPYIMWRERIPR